MQVIDPVVAVQGIYACIGFIALFISALCYAFKSA